MPVATNPEKIVKKVDGTKEIDVSIMTADTSETPTDKKCSPDIELLPEAKKSTDEKVETSIQAASISEKDIQKAIPEKVDEAVATKDQASTAKPTEVEKSTETTESKKRTIDQISN